MTGQTISHYKILEKLGEGGMGVVYKADDLKLKRTVALKFLPHHLTANSVEQARFLQEAQAASGLNHPHVCTIYDIAEEGGQQFIVMEYVDGTTLRQKIAGPASQGHPAIDVKDTVNYAVQIGEALQEAHGKGIVHRDIKADNIMVNSRNQVKVMDFGLAKLKGSMKLTRTSSTIGTLGYMAPEQIRGGEVDVRSDIFSFGIVIYEMLTGRLPFRGEHEAAMMYAILNEQPEPMEKYRPEISSELGRIVNRAMEKDPEDRYQSAADIVSELRRFQKQSTRVERPPTTGVAAPGSKSPAPPIQASEASPKRRQLIVSGSVLGILALGAVVYFMFIPKAQPEKTRIDSIAVLPFTNVGADPNTEYLSDGISENIINALSRLQKLRVIPRSTVFHYKGKEADPQTVGNELKVRAVLTGRVVQRGDNLNIQAELVDIQSQSQLWGEQYNRKVADLLSVQDEISRDIAAKLQLQLSGEEEKKLTRRPTENPEAYQLYLKGRFYWSKRSAGDIQKGIEFFQQAIDKDPTYALAYAGLADCYAVLPQYSGLPSTEIVPRAREAAQKALKIDSTLADAHNTLAFVLEELDWDFTASEAEYKRAIELNPDYPTAHHWYSILLAQLVRNDEAIGEAERAYQLDPLSVIINNLRAVTWYWKGEYDRADKLQRKTLELDSTSGVGHLTMGHIDLQRHMVPEALAEYEKAVRIFGRRVEPLAGLGYAYAVDGQRSKAMDVIGELKQLGEKGFDPTVPIAVVNLGLGQKEECFAWLEKAYQARSGWILTLQTDRRFDSIRGDPRFASLVKRVGLTR
jgi:serine/threonine-protein kinase